MIVATVVTVLVAAVVCLLIWAHDLRADLQREREVSRRLSEARQRDNDRNAHSNEMWAQLCRAGKWSAFEEGFKMARANRRMSLEEAVRMSGIPRHG